MGGALRIGDADREAALALLGEHYAVGRLSKDEFDERSDAVWSARTRDDLDPVFVDLPRPSPAPVGAGPRPSRRADPWRRAGPSRKGWGWRVPLVPVLLVLVALTVLTGLPVVLLVLGVWLLFAPRCRR